MSNELNYTDSLNRKIESQQKEIDRLNDLLVAQNEMYNEVIVSKGLITTENTKLKEDKADMLKVIAVLTQSNTTLGNKQFKDGGYIDNLIEDKEKLKERIKELDETMVETYNAIEKYKDVVAKYYGKTLVLESVCKDLVKMPKGVESHSYSDYLTKQKEQ